MEIESKFINPSNIYTTAPMKTIDAFILYTHREQVIKTVHQLKQTDCVKNIYLLAPKKEMQLIDGCEIIDIDRLESTKTIQKIADTSTANYILIYQKSTGLQLGYFALERMLKVAEDSNAGMVYSDYYTIEDDIKKKHPVIDYQEGSLRDDFNFGSLILYRSSALKEATKKMNHQVFEFAGIYDLRLKVSQKHKLIHINEYLYSEVEEDRRKSGEKIFDYVDPKNREVQIEMELACTQHLKDVGGYLEPLFQPIEFDSEKFEYEASVIIPVRNRIRTIRDAIKSLLIQKTTFKFNIIVIDNHSEDGTTEAIKELAKDERIVHVIPNREDLGIGGCWNMGVHHAKCGKFAVQLDSDDLYSGVSTLQTIVDAFYVQNCAMVVGTYQMTDFDLNPIPPGIIDHKEWTPKNGRNNALRINGLGAPRAFYTPVLRDVKVPNTSYGEDYALGLNISRNYQIGRIYDVLYLVRRWEDNTDAALNIVQMNEHNTYKDRIRTWELQARKKMNQKV